MSITSHGRGAALDVSAGEHKFQLALVQTMCMEVRNGADRRAVGTALEQLEAYSDTHFRSEEQLMRLKGYDEYSDHVKDHAQIRTILRGLSINHALGSSKLSAGEVDGMLEFINHHIVTRDRRFVEYLLRERWK